MGRQKAAMAMGPIMGDATHALKPKDMEMILCVWVCSSLSCVQLFCDLMDYSPPALLCPLDFPGNTGVGSHSLPQGIFLTQGMNLSLLHCRYVLYHRATWELINPQIRYNQRMCPGLINRVLFRVCAYHQGRQE